MCVECARIRSFFANVVFCKPKSHKHEKKFVSSLHSLALAFFFLAKMHRSVLLSVLVLLAAPVAALLPGAGRSLSATRPAAVSARMGPAEDGPFTPLCLVGKVVLGQTTFNKYRGKVISIHSG